MGSALVTQVAENLDSEGQGTDKCVTAVLDLQELASASAPYQKLLETGPLSSSDIIDRLNRHHPKVIDLSLRGLNVFSVT